MVVPRWRGAAVGCPPLRWGRSARQIPGKRKRVGKRLIGFGIGAPSGVSSRGVASALTRPIGLTEAITFFYGSGHRMTRPCL